MSSASSWTWEIFLSLVPGEIDTLMSAKEKCTNSFNFLLSFLNIWPILPNPPKIKCENRIFKETAVAFVGGRTDKDGPNPAPSLGKVKFLTISTDKALLLRMMMRMMVLGLSWLVTDSG